MFLKSISRGWPRLGGRKVLPSVALVGTIILALSYTRTPIPTEDLPATTSAQAYRIRTSGGQDHLVSGIELGHEIGKHIGSKGNEESQDIVLDTVNVTPTSKNVGPRDQKSLSGDILSAPFAASSLLSSAQEVMSSPDKPSVGSQSTNAQSLQQQSHSETTNSSKILRHVVLDATNPRHRTLWAAEKGCGVHDVRFALPGSLPLCALASYPGSGNTWARYLIEAASGVFTGSIYKDQQLYMSGYYGELNDWKTGSTIVQKTHDCGANHIQDFGSCGVLLLRNPYKAILSFHNYLFGGHTGYAKISNYRRKDWSIFVHLQARRWLEMAVNWTNNARDLHVVHYENLKEDPTNPLKDIMEFRSLASDEQRLDCIMKHKKFKYHRKEEYLPKNLDIFSPKLRDMIDRAIRYVDFTLHKRGLHPLPLHLYDYYNGTSSKQISLIGCNKGETESQCDERIDQINLKNMSNKTPQKATTTTASATEGKVKVYKYSNKAEVKKGNRLEENYAPTGIEKFSATKIGSAITSLGFKVMNLIADDPIKAEIKNEKDKIKPKLKLDQEFGNGDVNKLNNYFQIYKDR